MLEVTEAIKEHRRGKAKGQHGFDFCLSNCLTTADVSTEKNTTANTEYKTGLML